MTDIADFVRVCEEWGGSVEKGTCVIRLNKDDTLILDDALKNFKKPVYYVPEGKEGYKPVAASLRKTEVHSPLVAKTLIHKIYSTGRFGSIISGDDADPIIISEDIVKFYPPEPKHPQSMIR